MAKEHLTEVDYLRVILIFALVGYHAFAPFCGAWRPISDVQIPAYWWFGKICYSFMLEAFVFISGYVFGFQVRQKGVQLLSLNSILHSKLKRLLLPSIVFSSIYLLIFGLKDGESMAQACYSIVDGRAHMWFLPMLFWCFIYIALIERFNFRTTTVVIAAVACTWLSFLPLPLRLGTAFYYFPFFYVGYIIQRNSLKFNSIITPPYFRLLIISILYITSFVLLTWIQAKWVDVSRICNLLTVSFKLVYSSLGVVMIYAVCKWVSMNGNVPELIVKAAPFCFGIYLFQQFILQAFYYQFPTSSLSPYLSPWFAYLVTLVLSAFLAWAVRQTKVGKKYI